MERKTGHISSFLKHNTSIPIHSSCVQNTSQSRDATIVMLSRKFHASVVMLHWQMLPNGWNCISWLPGFFLIDIRHTTLSNHIGHAVSFWLPVGLYAVIPFPSTGATVVPTLGVDLDGSGLARHQQAGDQGRGLWRRAQWNDARRALFPLLQQPQTWTPRSENKKIWVK